MKKNKNRKVLQHPPVLGQYLICFLTNSSINNQKHKFMKIYLSKEYFDLTERFIRKMRTTCLLIILFASSLLAGNVNSQTSKININSNHTTLIQVIRAIEDQTDYLFVYDKNEIDLTQEVNVSAKNRAVSDVLKEIFNETEVSYALEGNNIMLMSLNVLQQLMTVSGKVSDVSGTALPGVTVVIKGTTQGTITDVDGNYEIDNVPAGGSLVFSFVGMRSKEINVNGRSVVNVSLEEETIGLEEVVAIGYGVQKKSDITGAVASVTSEDLSKIVTSTPVQALQGKAAGVSVVMSSGSPDATASIKIRGVGTTNNTDPLYVVDGLPMSDIDYLNPNDIESIEILKDASATAIYGSRGANGVILVTTKKGKKGELNVNINAYYGVETLMDAPEMLNSEQYAILSNEAYSNAGLSAPYANTSNLPYDTDWYDEVSRLGTVENYNLSFSGGSERINSFLSGNYFSRKGIIKSTDFEKLSFIQNSNIKATDFLNFDTSISGTFSKYSRLDPTSVFLSSLIAPPDLPVINPETDYYAGIHKLRLANPLGRIARNNSENKNTNLVGNITTNLNITKDLVFRSVFGIRYTEGRSSSFEPVYFETSDISTLINTVDRSSSRSTDWTWDNILTYSKTLGDHDITAMGAISAREYSYDYFYASKQDVSIEEKEFWYFDAASANPQNSGNGASLSMLSYLGRINYNYKDKYLITGSFRADGSSRFTEDNRWGYFPSGAIAWRLSEEGFFKDLDQSFLENVKIRAGYGEIGNERIESGEIGNERIESYYPYLTPIEQQQYYTIGVSQTRTNGAGTSALGNPDVQWETSTQSNIGLDLMFWDGKLSTTMDYYIRKTDNILLAQQVPQVSGFGSLTRNVGGMENKGFEFSATYKESKGDFSYDIAANFSTVKNKVTNLGNTDALVASFDYDYVLIDFQGAFGNIIRSEVGQPYGQFFGWETDGIFQNQTEIDQYTHEGEKIQPGALPGDFRFKDNSGDGKIDDADKVFIGNPIPDFIFGLTFNASYRKFDLSMSFQGQAGNEIYNAAKYYFMKFDGRQNVRTEYLDEYWKGENSSNSQPIVTQNLNRNQANFRNSDYYIEDGSYIRLQNIQLGYNFSPFVKGGFKPDCRIYVSSQNLLTITGYSGFEPEVSSIGVDRGVYPQSTTFMIGTIINF